MKLNQIEFKIEGFLCFNFIVILYIRKTGKVFNVTPNGIGVVVKKKIGNRYIEKKLLVRVEHIKPSKSRNEFVSRVKENGEKAKVAKTDKGKRILLCYSKFKLSESVFNST